MKAFSTIQDLVSSYKKNQPAAAPAPVKKAPAASVAPAPVKRATAPTTSPATATATAPSPYAAPIKLDRSGVSKEFDVHREKAAQAENATLQGQKDALARRAAQLGGGPSGALLKQEALATDAMGRRLGDANAMINSAQAAELRRIGEMEQGLNFQREERLGGQQFQQGERLGGQEFQQGQFDKTLGISQQQIDLEKQKAADQKDHLGKTLAFTEGQTALENREAQKQNLISTMLNLKTNGFPPDKIGEILSSFGLDFESLGIDPSILEVEGVTKAAPQKTQAPVVVSSPDGSFGKVWRKEGGTGRMYYIDQNGNKRYS